MKKRMMKSLFAGCLALTGLCTAAPILVPAPREYKPTSGFCPAEKAVFTGYATDTSLPKEGYALEITTAGVTVRAADAAGAFWARQTLRQLEETQDGKRVLACATIRDWPEFAWRGYLLDVSRHFFSVDDVKRVLDQMAYHKLNVFHWHLTDGAGWRCPSARYPELNRKGATRGSQVKRTHRYLRDVEDCGNGKYGPYFYTREQVRDVLAYAAARHIRVMPEIEIPGHSDAAIRAYPELSCHGYGNELCIGNDATIKFYENVLDEVCELFPDPFIHIGGDECSTNAWGTCAKCQARKKTLGLKDEHELQYWITRHFADYLEKKGKRILGWDEIALADLPKSAAVMKWRLGGKADDACRRGHDIVFTSSWQAYVDYSQGLLGDRHEYPSFAGRLTPRGMYRLDPYAGVPADCRARILGGEGAAWTEVTACRKELEWKTWPRMGVVAEVFWHYEPVTARRPDDFLARLAAHRERLVAMGVNAAPLGPLEPEYIEIKPGVKIPWGGSTSPVLCEKITAAVSGVVAKRNAQLAPGAYKVAIDWRTIAIEHADDAALAEVLAILNRVAKPLEPGVLAVPAIVFEGRAQ